MKKILSSLIAIVLLFCCTVGCLADEPYTKTYTENVIGKYVRYTKEAGYITDDEPEDNIYTVVTPDGGKISVVTEADGVTLVVYPITTKDKDAYKWLKKKLPNTVGSFEAFDIFFIDENGKRLEMPEDAKIKMYGAKKDQFVLGVTADGKVSEIKAAILNKVATFSANKEYRYYLLCNKSVLNIPGVDTGDATVIGFWIIVMIGSAVALIILCKKKTNV